MTTGFWIFSIMARFTIILAAISILKLSSAAQLEILYAPSSLQFRDDATSPLDSSQLTRFLSLCLGYTTKKPDWNGFGGYKAIANIPQSVVVFHMPVSLRSIATNTFPLNIDSNLALLYDQMKDIMVSRHENGVTAEMVPFDSTDSLQKYLDQRKAETRPTLLWFEMSEPHQKDVDAKFEKLVEQLKSLLGERVLIVSLSDQEATLARETRAAKDQEKKSPNLAYRYSANFHNGFAIIGFTTVLFVLAVFVIAVGMWNIDPGRDSIIYRLTSQKMKKDK